MTTIQHAKIRSQVEVITIRVIMIVIIHHQDRVVTIIRQEKDKNDDDDDDDNIKYTKFFYFKSI